MTTDNHIDSPPLVFLFGFERSGTTLLSMMVGAHPQIAVPLSLTGLWYRYGQQLHRYNGLAAAGDVERIVDDLLQEERIRLWDVALTRDEVLHDLEPGSYPRVIARFQSLYAKHKGKLYWGNIDIDTMEEMDVANAWFPQVKFVHIVRDGRDVALSHKTYAYGASNVGECTDQWGRSVRLNVKMGAILGPQRYLIVRYEDLILNPEPVLRRLCEFLDVSYSPAMLEYEKMVATKIPSDRRWLWPLLDQPPVKSNVFRWKKQMTDSERIVVERRVGSILGDLGYEIYTTIPKRLRANALELWYFLGEGGRLRRLAGKLGAGGGKALAR
jgi:hypothetical protein